MKCLFSEIIDHLGTSNPDEGVCFSVWLGWLTKWLNESRNGRIQVRTDLKNQEVSTQPFKVSLVVSQVFHRQTTERLVASIGTVRSTCIRTMQCIKTPQFWCSVRIWNCMMFGKSTEPMGLCRIWSDWVFWGSVPPLVNLLAIPSTNKSHRNSLRTCLAGFLLALFSTTRSQAQIHVNQSLWDL